MDLRRLPHDLDRDERLDQAVDAMRRAAEPVVGDGPAGEALRGRQLGHPLHPMLTDLPIGLWTSAFLLDLFGGRRSRPLADAFVGLGVACALPTAAAGLADWTRLDHPKQRTGLVHLASNALATVLYTASFLHRRRGHRVRGVLLGLGGASAATAGGFLGGHLAFGEATSDPRATAADDGHDPGQGVDPGLHRVS